MPKPVAHCHVRIREVAIEAAAELYGTVMENNEVRAEWKRRHPGAGEKGLLDAFIARYWPDCIPFARATLAHMLSPGMINSLDPATADAIMEALRLDASLVRGRGRRGEILGRRTG